jgi:hypothetical protein
LFFKLRDLLRLESALVGQVAPTLGGVVVSCGHG